MPPASSCGAVCLGGHRLRRRSEGISCSQMDGVKLWRLSTWKSGFKVVKIIYSWTALVPISDYTERYWLKQELGQWSFVFLHLFIALNPKCHPHHFLECFTPFIIIPPVLHKHTFNKKWSTTCTPIIQHRIIFLAKPTNEPTRDQQ